MRKNKYKRGDPLNINELIEEIGAQRFVYLRDTPKHHGWMVSMQLRTLIGFCKRGMIYRAIPTASAEKSGKNSQ